MTRRDLIIAMNLVRSRQGVALLPVPALPRPGRTFSLSDLDAIFKKFYKVELANDALYQKIRDDMSSVDAAAPFKIPIYTRQTSKIS